MQTKKLLVVTHYGSISPSVGLRKLEDAYYTQKNSENPVRVYEFVRGNLEELFPEEMKRRLDLIAQLPQAA